MCQIVHYFSRKLETRHEIFDKGFLEICHWKKEPVRWNDDKARRQNTYEHTQDTYKCIYIYI